MDERREHNPTIYNADAGFWLAANAKPPTPVHRVLVRNNQIRLGPEKVLCFSGCDSRSARHPDAYQAEEIGSGLAECGPIRATPKSRTDGPALPG
jgi:hypothetical protein